MWEEIYRKFRKENSSVTQGEFYIEDTLALFVDLRSMKENDLHGSGLRLLNTKYTEYLMHGVHLTLKRRISESGEVRCRIFILPDAQFNIKNHTLESVKIL